MGLSAADSLRYQAPPPHVSTSERRAGETEDSDQDSDDTPEQDLIGMALCAACEANPTRWSSVAHRFVYWCVQILGHWTAWPRCSFSCWWCSSAQLPRQSSSCAPRRPWLPPCYLGTRFEWLCVCTVYAA